MSDGRDDLENLLLDALILEHCIPDESAELELQNCCFVGAESLPPATQTSSQPWPSRSPVFQSNEAVNQVRKEVEIMDLGSSDDDDDDDDLGVTQIESRGNRFEQVQRISKEDLQALMSIGPVINTDFVNRDEDLDENDKSRKAHSKGISKWVDGGSTSVDEGKKLPPSIMGGGDENIEEAARAVKTTLIPSRQL